MAAANATDVKPGTEPEGMTPTAVSSGVSTSSTDKGIDSTKSDSMQAHQTDAVLNQNAEIAITTPEPTAPETSPEIQRDGLSLNELKVKTHKLLDYTLAKTTFARIDQANSAEELNVWGALGAIESYYASKGGLNPEAAPELYDALSTWAAKMLPLSAQASASENKHQTLYQEAKKAKKDDEAKAIAKEQYEEARAIGVQAEKALTDTELFAVIAIAEGQREDSSKGKEAHCGVL